VQDVPPTDAPRRVVRIADIKRDRERVAPAALESVPDKPGELWKALGLSCGDKGPYPTIANACNVLAQHPRIAGRVWWDEFRGAIFYDDPDHDGQTVEWTDYHDVQVTAWMQEALKLPKMPKHAVADAVLLCARRNSRHPLKEWLESLHWDGTERLSTWLSDCLGVARSGYSEAVGRNWLISMIARVYRPGCQVDHMPILEGPQGRGKSSFLRLLAGEWYSALPEAFGGKDFLHAIIGRWLIEVPDLAGFNKRDHQHILAVVTTPVDRFRAAYDRRPEDHARTCVFSATSETSDYLQDPRGRRRFWPLACEGIDLKAFELQRAQLFAEAMRQHAAGVSWHQVPEGEADAQQLERVDDDVWSEPILEYVRLRPNQRFSSADLLSIVVGIEREDQNDGQKRRVVTIMRTAGWEQKVEKMDGSTVRRWRKKDAPII